MTETQEIERISARPVMDDAISAGKTTVLLDTRQAAKHLDQRPANLEKWRFRGKGPKFLRMGGMRGKVRYRLSDLQEYLEQCVVVPSEQQKARSRKNRKQK